MKKVLAGVTVLTLLAFGAIAYAGPGFWGGGHMMGSGYEGYGMGPGYGGHMMEQAYGGHMYGRAGSHNQKFLNETAELRKELHNKRFEYFEALRNPETKVETITKLEKQIGSLQDKIFEKAPRTAGRYGYGCN